MTSFAIWDAAHRPPTVSVLIKAYNHAAYIGQTIESILAQSFQDFEIVVTDDASTDSTADIVRRYKDPRLKLEILPGNLGISGAMNATIARAHGSYLAILNSDDWAFSSRLSRQVTFLDHNPGVAAVFGLPKAVGENGEPVAAFNDFGAPLRFPDFARATWLRHFFAFSNCLCAPAAMIRREAYRTAGPYDRRLTNLQDLDMWIRMLAAGLDLHLLPEEVTAFRIRDNHANMSAPSPEKTTRSRFELGKVLRHYAAMPPALLEAIFGAALGGPRTHGRSAPLRLAEMALRDPRIEYKAFALDLIYENAADTADFNWLRDLAGSVDLRGSRTIQTLCSSIAAREIPAGPSVAMHRSEVATD